MVATGCGPSLNVAGHQGRLQGESCCPQPDRGNPAVRDETGGRKKLTEARNEAPACSDEEPVTATPRCPPPQRLRSIPTDYALVELVRTCGNLRERIYNPVRQGTRVRRRVEGGDPTTPRANCDRVRHYRLKLNATWTVVSTSAGIPATLIGRYSHCFTDSTAAGTNRSGPERA
jgi:hypothetical protein